ncbi:MAG: HlyD family efflux transporter periplasmic adaptor subunit [Gammaproteobacteria bacterium]|nr:HlyD family efflux transporter periplasmic adaptor subunit [Gammaproteobacteria bacterium]
MFRQQALDNKKKSSRSGVLLREPQSFRWRYYIATALFACFLLLFFFGKFNNRAIVFGYVETVDASLAVKALTSGVIEDVLITEDQLVTANATIATLNTRALYAEQGDAVLSSINTLTKLLESNEKKRANAVALYQRSLKRIQDEIELNKTQLDLLNTQLNINQKKLATLTKKLESNQALASRGLIAKEKLLLIEDELLNNQEQRLQVARQRVQLNGQVQKLKNELAEKQSAHNAELLALDEEKLNLVNDREKLRFERKHAIITPSEGKISNLKVKPGQYVAEGELLAEILPEKRDFELLLTVPASSIAAFKVGKVINIKLDAFPYQEHGIFTAEIVSVPKSAVKHSEYLHGKKISEPVYLVKALLNQLSETKQALEFKKGMTFSAEIIRSEKTLFERVMN